MDLLKQQLTCACEIDASLMQQTSDPVEQPLTSPSKIASVEAQKSFCLLKQQLTCGSEVDGFPA